MCLNESSRRAQLSANALRRLAFRLPRHNLPHLAFGSRLSFHRPQQRTGQPRHNRGSSMKKLVLAALLAATACISVAKAQDVPTIRVGWTIPAEESKYWMMRRPAEFPNLGKTYNIEWTQFQGTSPMTQALAAGALDCATQGVLPIAQGMAKNTLSLYVVAQHVGENKDSFHGLLGGEGRFTDQDGRGPEGQDRRHLDHRRRHAGAVQPDAAQGRHRSRQGHQAGRSVVLALRGRAASGPRRRGQHEPAVRGARRGQGRHPQAVRACRRAAEHRAHRGSVPEGFRRQESRTW